MRKRIWVFALVMLTFSVMLIPVPSVQGDLTAYGTEYVDDHIMFQPTTYPTAFYEDSVDTTFIAYMRNDTNVLKFYMKTFNHTTETMSDAVHIGTSAVAFDRHNAPGIGHLPNGSIIYFFDTHSYTPGYVSYRVSVNAWDISSWYGTQTHTLDATYPNVCSFDDKCVLFIRDSCDDMLSIQWYRYDFNNTHMFQNETKIVANYGAGEGGLNLGAGGWYATFHIDGPSERIVCAGHLWNDTASKAVYLYYAYSDDQGVTWYYSNGTSASLPLDEDAKVLDLSGGGYNTFYPFALYDHEDTQQIMFSQQDSGDVDAWLGLARNQSNGWSWQNVTDGDGNMINHTRYGSLISYPIRDYNFNRTVFWGPSMPNAKLARYVQSAEDPFTFVRILETDIDAPNGLFESIQDHKTPYEMVVDIQDDSNPPDENEEMYLVYNNASYVYAFHGVYDESSGILKDPVDRAVSITAFFAEQNPETFTLNGTYWYGGVYRPLYFLFNTSVNREYWIGENEDEATIYVFDTTNYTTYTINFLDLVGVLSDYPFVSASRYVNGTLTVVEKRKIDVAPKIQMVLESGQKYVIRVHDGVTWTWGDLLFGSTTELELVLKLEFTEDRILYYRDISMEANRHNNGTQISFLYEDLSSGTETVYVWLKHEDNDTLVYSNWENATQSFNHTVSSGLYWDAQYYGGMVATHESYGELTWHISFIRKFDVQHPWDIDFLGTLPIETYTIVPLGLIFASLAIFSRVSAPVGCLAGVSVATIVTAIGWIDIPPALLAFAFGLTILFWIVHARRTAT